MKTLYLLGILGAVALAAGCNQRTETTSTEADQNTSTAQRQEDQSLAPTSDKETKRVYADTPRPSDATPPADTARTTTDSTDAAARDADNTGRNVRDRDDATLTPGDQGNTKADIETTRRIRKAINANDQLSTTAKNIKIITVDGKVTLRGPVNSEREKQTIESIVKQAGLESFDNQLEVKTTNQ